MQDAATYNIHSRGPCLRPVRPHPTVDVFLSCHISKKMETGTNFER